MKSLVSSHHSRGEFAGSSHWQDSAIEDLDHRSHDSSTQDISRRDEPPSAHSRAQLRSRRFSNRSSPDQGASDAPEDFPGHLSWKNRLRYFTWPFFTITMATGGIANVLYHVPFRFHGLTAIGDIFFLFNIFLFIVNIVCISLRFHFHPDTFRLSLLRPAESVFVPAAVVSLGTVLLNISQYGLPHSGYWLNDAVCILFWTEAALAILVSSGVYLMMWSTQTFTISHMTPVWIFPAYPLLIIGSHAGVLSAQLDQQRALDIITGGFTIQGIGFSVSIMVYSAFLYRLMTQKLPEEVSRPGMFVSVGPAGFTASSIINMAQSAQKALPQDFMGDGATVAMIIKVVGNWMSLWLWGLAIWFFIISAGAHWPFFYYGRDKFAISWWSFIFPNTALVTATFAVGDAFGSRAIQVVGCVMTCILVLGWMAVFLLMIWAIKQKEILWPPKGEYGQEDRWMDPQLKITEHSNGSTRHVADNESV